MVDPKIVDDDCARQAYGAVAEFFGTSIDKIEVCNFAQLVDSLVMIGLRVDLVLPARFLFWPKWWRYRHLAIARSTAIEKIQDGERKAVVYYALAEELYDVKDVWTHVVVDFYCGKGRSRHFDSYALALNKDYPGASQIAGATMRLTHERGVFAIVRNGPGARLKS